MTIAPRAILAPAIGAALGLLLGQTQLWSGFSFSLFDPAHWAFLVRNAGNASIGFWSAFALAIALPPAGGWLAWRLTDRRAGSPGHASKARIDVTPSAREGRSRLADRALAPWTAFIARSRGALAGWRGVRDSEGGQARDITPPSLKTPRTQSAPDLRPASGAEQESEDFLNGQVNAFADGEWAGDGNDFSDSEAYGFSDGDSDAEIDPSSPPDWLNAIADDDSPDDVALDEPSPPGTGQPNQVSGDAGRAWMQEIREGLMDRKLLWMPNPKVVWNTEREGRRLLFHDGFDMDASASADIVVGTDLVVYLVFLAPWSVAGTIGGRPRQAEPRPDELRLEGLEDWTTPDGTRHPCPLTRAARALRRFRSNWYVDCRLHNWRPEPDMRAIVLLPELPAEAGHLLELDESERRRQRVYEAIEICHTPVDLLDALTTAASDGEALRRIEVYRSVFDRYTKAA